VRTRKRDARPSWALSEEESARAVELCQAVGLVRRSTAMDGRDDFLFNDFLWGENIAPSLAE
jgi:hypothetical protein